MDILNSIPILDEEVSKFQLDDASSIHFSLTLDNPLTYKIFLSKRPDLSKEDIEIYEQIIQRLEHNERVRYGACFKNMVDSSEINDLLTKDPKTQKKIN